MTKMKQKVALEVANQKSKILASLHQPAQEVM